MRNKITIIVPCYGDNAYMWECYESIISQEYNDYRIIFANDNTEDTTFFREIEEMYKDEKITVFHNKERTSAVGAIHNALMSVEHDDEDIIMLVDGDDKLITGTLQIVNRVYNEKKPLLTYGNFVSSIQLHGGANKVSEKDYNNIRNTGFFLHHLRTFKWKAYKELLKQDPEVDALKHKGKFYCIAGDVAMMNALGEIVGYNNIEFIEERIYWYRIHEKNDNATYDGRLQQVYAENVINRQKKFETKF